MLRIGLLGAARIAPPAILMPAGEIEGVTVTAIAARDPARARAFAETHAIPAAAEDYAALVTRADVDLVYVALPPAAHATWCIAALQAGKHVLCEKPFAMTMSETEAVLAAAAAAGRRVIEATHYIHHPLIQRALAIAASGRLGRLRRLEGVFNAPIRDDPTEFRRLPEHGGGGFRDLGFYPLHFARSLLRAEPRVTSAEARWLAPGVDETLSTTLAFPGGVEATVSSAMDLAQPPRATARLEGEAGVLTVTSFVQPALAGALTVETAQGAETEAPEPLDWTYPHQLRAVALALARGTALPYAEGPDIRGQMAAMTAIYAAAAPAA